MIRFLFLLLSLHLFLLNSFAQVNSTKVRAYLKSAKTLIKTGHLFFKLGDYDSTIVYWSKIIIVLEEDNYLSVAEKQEHIANAYHDIDLVYYYKGDYR